MSVPATILVVEDNPDDFFLLQQAFLLAQAEPRLEQAWDGLQAVAYLKGEGARQAHPLPDFMLLDLNLPRMNGFEFLEWLRPDAQCGCLMVHILTASSLKADVERAYRLHANSYTIKPARLDGLVAYVKALCQW